MLLTKLNCLNFSLLSIFILNWVTVLRADEGDPDSYLRTNQLIEKYGFPSETHFLVTKDGFNLTIFRIPNPSGQPVLLQHGILMDSSGWCLNRNESLAFLLSQAGYDVWINNFRGTNYSDRHIKYTPEQYEFWDWTWTEISMYDTAQTLEYISNETKQLGKTLYIGYSLGTTVLFGLMSAKPEYGQYVKSMFALAPTIYLRHVKGLLRGFTVLLADTRILSRLARIGPFPFPPDDELLPKLIQVLCDPEAFQDLVCKNMLFASTGIDPNFNNSIIELFTGHFPSPVSLKTFIHLGQLVKANKFQHYDHGLLGNLKHYKSVSPPQYDLSKINVTVNFYWGQNDWLSSEQDVKRTWSELTHKGIFYTMDPPEWTHLNFIYHPNVKKLLYDPLIEHLRKYQP